MSKQPQRNNNEFKTFAVPFTLKELQENITIAYEDTKNYSNEQIINQAITFQLQGDISKAKKYYKYIIDKGVKDPIIFSNFGSILKDLGKLEEAEIYTRKAIELKPDTAAFYSNLGIILKDRGKLNEAEKSLIKAIELKPDFANSYYNLGITLNKLGKLEKAEFSICKAIQLNPDFGDAYSVLGHILKDLGKLKEAEISFVKAIELKPDSPLVYCNLFRHFVQTNNLELLEKALEKFRKVKNIRNELFLFSSRLSYLRKEYKSAKAIIDNISSEWVKKSTNKEQIIFWSYKGFIEEKNNNYDLAYSCFKNSQADLEYKKFNKQLFINYIQSYKLSIKHKKYNSIATNHDSDEINLAFLIGFPRSGTTLLDTILRSHPDLEVIEEKPLISEIEYIVQEKLNKNLNDIYSLSDDELRQLRQTYYNLLNKYINKKAKIIIDKMPLNTVCIPLINLLFPNAKIIFTHRHPYDTVLSCFQQMFDPNDAMASLISIDSSANVYNQVMEAWDKYKNELQLNYITSRYEDLINNFDEHTLKIVRFLKIQWTDDIKYYRKTALDRDIINTPSSYQVIQPLYKSSINKWKNYEKFFDTSDKYLTKWVSYFEY